MFVRLFEFAQPDHNIDVAVLHDRAATGTDVALVTADVDRHGIGFISFARQKFEQCRLEFIHGRLIDTGSGFLIVPRDHEISLGDAVYAA